MDVSTCLLHMQIVQTETLTLIISTECDWSFWTWLCKKIYYRWTDPCRLLPPPWCGKCTSCTRYIMCKISGRSSERNALKEEPVLESLCAGVVSSRDSKHAGGIVYPIWQENVLGSYRRREKDGKNLAYCHCNLNQLKSMDGRNEWCASSYEISWAHLCVSEGKHLILVTPKAFPVTLRYYHLYWEGSSCSVIFLQLFYFSL